MGKSSFTSSLTSCSSNDKYPKTVPYEMNELVVDLLSYANEFLVVGGRLVYWLPTITDEYEPSDVPSHPNMRLIANSEQVFSKWSRRLITMEKIKNDTILVGNLIDKKMGESMGHSFFSERFFGRSKG